MKKLKPRRYVIVGDTTYYHGDYVTACIGPRDDDDDDTVEIDEGRICINKEDDDQQGERHFQFWICQNDRDGCSSAETTFDYQYSWSVRVNKDGLITSGDTEWVSLDRRCDPLDVETVVDVNPSTEEPSEEKSKDDDPMPEDWVPSEKDLLFLKG